MLAGGGGTRLGGRAKPLLRVGGERIIDRLRAALEPRLPVWISGRSHAPWAELGLPFVPDLRPGGPLAGIEAGLQRAAPGALLAVAGDMPFVSTEAVQFLLAADDGRGVAIDDGRRNPPLFGIWPAAALPVLRARLDRGQRSVGEAVRALRLPRVRLPAGLARACFNVNTPQHLRDADARSQPGS